jgi:molybdenum cofactor synthesis domain-containing protein
MLFAYVVAHVPFEVCTSAVCRTDAVLRRAASETEVRGGRTVTSPYVPSLRSVPSAPLAAKILTVSDSVHAGTREDRSGEALAELLGMHGFAVVERRTVPDGIEPVASALREMAAGFAGLLVTTGGTGFAPRDLTPEATRTVLDREAPGFAEAMRAVSPLGRLSRGMAGTLGSCVVVNLPGSPAGATESLAAVLDVVPHALELSGGGHPH